MVSGKPSCITEGCCAHGYYWRYSHAPGEPEEALDMAIRIATMVAGTEANRSGKTHVVASTPQPSPAVFVLARTHPDLPAIA
jgi:hypothetical protein